MGGEMVKDLLAAGSDANARGKNGETALLFAVEAKHGDMVKALLDAGADFQAVKNKDKTLVMYTAIGEEKNWRIPLANLLRKYKPRRLR